MTGVYLNLSFILLNFGLAPITPIMSGQSPIDGTEVFDLWVEANDNSNNMSLSTMQEFYYDFLHGSPYFYSFAMGRDQPLIVGGTELSVEKFDWNAFELFGSEFEIQSGRNFVYNDFGNFSGYFPIILGNAFSEHNEVGDIFLAEYFFNQWDFKVVGILEPNQYFANNMGPDDFRFLTPLDYNIFIPFISNRNPINQRELAFWFSMYELMIQSTILVESNQITIDHMLNTIHTGLQHTNMEIRVETITGGVFSSIEIQNLVRAQQELMIVFLGSLTLIFLLIFGILCNVKIRRIQQNLKSLMIVGYKRWKIYSVFLSEGVILFSLLFILMHEYWMWDSGFLMRDSSLLTSRIWLNSPQRETIWRFYLIFWKHSRALKYAAFLLFGTFMYNLIFPILATIKLYHGR